MAGRGISKEAAMSSPAASRNRPSLSLLLTFGLLLAPSVFGATPAKPKGTTFEGAAQVVAVEVPVNVVDKNGEPLRGLTADNFEIYDGNEKQPIATFEVVDLATYAPDESGEVPQAKLDALPPGARRRFLLMFDLSFSSPTSILKARMAARDFLLNSLQPVDLAAVATYSLENGPKLIVTFTSDRLQLVRAIDTFGMRRALDTQVKNDPLRFMIEAPRDSRSAQPSLDFGGGDDIRNGALLYDYLQSISIAQQKIERSYEAGRVQSYSRALGDVAKSLNAVKGRKNVILFSEGFDSRLFLGRDTTDAEAITDNAYITTGQPWLVDNDARYGNTNVQADLNKMLEEFRRADCVIQSVDIGGLRGTGPEAGQAPHYKGEEGLFYMANETGGELFKDANNLRDPLSRVLTRTSLTYLLTFERSDLKTDGAYHRLKVKAKLPPGARMAHRSGYYAPRPYKELDSLERSLLASDSIASSVPRSELALNVLTAPFRAGEESAYVPVIVEVGGRGLLTEQAGDKLNVDFFGYVSDLKGEMRDFFTQRVALDLDKKQGRKSLENSGIKYYGHFDLPSGSYRLRVLVRNADTGRTGVTTARIDVPYFAKAQPALLPPFFIESAQKWLLVRERTLEGEQSSIVYPFTVGGEPYIPSARPSLRADDSARFCLVAYNLGTGDLAVQGAVVDAAGRTTDIGTLKNIERTPTGIDGLQKMVATFEPRGLVAGDYVLRVAVTNPLTGLQETSSLAFQVQR
jgi:VWFA-related protein